MYGTRLFGATVVTAIGMWAPAATADAPDSDSMFASCRVLNPGGVSPLAVQGTTARALQFHLVGVGRGPDPVATSTRIDCWVNAGSPTSTPLGAEAQATGTAGGPVATATGSFTVSSPPAGVDWYVCGNVTSMPSGQLADLGCVVAFTW